MSRVMVFIDFENFNIALMNYYRSIEEPSPRLDYNKLPREVAAILPGRNELVKTYFCAPKPDDFLIQDERRKNMYTWITGLTNQKYFTVLEGQHVARPAVGYTHRTMDISNPGSYYVVEKGTDVNLSAHMLAKGFLDAYDTAVLMSGDSDYIPVLDILNTIGKITVTVGVCGQNMQRLKKSSDDTIFLNKNFFDRCLKTRYERTYESDFYTSPADPDAL